MFGRRYRLQATGRLNSKVSDTCEESRVFLTVWAKYLHERERRRYVWDSRILSFDANRYGLVRNTSLLDWFSDEDHAILPGLYETHFDRDPVAWVKLFTPWMECSWYVIEFDGHDRFFGFFRGLEADLGYFSLKDLKRIRTWGGQTVERAPDFEPTRLSLLFRGVR